MTTEQQKIPCAIFAFNRPDKLERVLDALKPQGIEQLIIFVDGPRNAGDIEPVEKCKAMAKAVDWADVEIVEREHNLGCAPNIIQGLTEVFQRYDRAVVLEDDTLPASSWYESLCLMLDRYANEPKVFSVGGFPSVKADAMTNYPYDVILSPRFSCWGWGTWSNRWNSLAPRVRNFRNPFKRVDDIPTHAGFDLRVAAESAETKPSQYWDIPIAIHCLYDGLLHAITRYYLVNNIGLDGGDHEAQSEHVINFMQANNQIEEKLPNRFSPMSLDPHVCDAVQRYIFDLSSTARSDARPSSKPGNSVINFLRKRKIFRRLLQKEKRYQQVHK